jgi:hypothetical protein
MKQAIGAALWVLTGLAGFWIGWQSRPKYQIAATERIVFRLDVRSGVVEFQALEVPGTGWVQLSETAQVPPVSKFASGR